MDARRRTRYREEHAALSVSDLAQTNVQLLREVITSGWSDGELRRLRAAYELAMQLYSGQYRANGKTQIAHHMGVASALHRGGASSDLVVAGAAHAFYTLGDFGTGRSGPDARKRALVRRALGTEIEILIFRYSRMRWDRETVEQMTHGVEAIEAERRNTIWMRVANEIDELLDARRQLIALDRTQAELSSPEGLEAVVALARAVDAQVLGGMLRDAAAVGGTFPVRESIGSARGNSVSVPPLSFRRRWDVEWKRGHLARRLAARVPGSRRARAWWRAKVS